MWVAQDPLLLGPVLDSGYWLRSKAEPERISNTRMSVKTPKR